MSLSPRMATLPCSLGNTIHSVVCSGWNLGPTSIVFSHECISIEYYKLVTVTCHFNTQHSMSTAILLPYLMFLVPILVQRSGIDSSTHQPGVQPCCSGFVGVWLTFLQPLGFFLGVFEDIHAVYGNPALCMGTQHCVWEPRTVSRQDKNLTVRRTSLLGTMYFSMEI